MTKVEPFLEKRQFLRHPINVPILIQRSLRREASSSESINVSPGGLSFMTPQKLVRGDKLTITIPVKDKRFRIKGRVVYSVREEKRRLYKTGVFFSDHTSAFEAKLAEETLEVINYQKKISKTLGYAVSEEDAAREWIKKYARFFPKRLST